MSAGEALCAVDDEPVALAGRDGGVFGREADVEAGDGEVRVLDIKVVCVAHGAVLEDGDGDVACDASALVSNFSSPNHFRHRGGSVGLITHSMSIH